ncbi:uroporphyrinogen decarboxylase family protein [Planctomycetota bacterium]|nr:uroporphyrinogen decarboxylase family protein [Planctomycetota bacterium]
MTGKEILMCALRGEATPRPAWLPYVGVHGGKLVDAPADKYLQSSDLIVKGLLRANELYRPDGLPIMFDLQMEAEVLGCQLKWAEKTPPAVVTHPMSLMEGDGKTLADLPEFCVTKGRFPIAFEALDRVKQEIGEDVALYSLLTGPFTLALHLLGNDIFMNMYDNPQSVLDVMDFCADIGCQVAKSYIEHGADVVAVVDPMTSQISSEHFDEFVTPYVNRIFDCIASTKAMSSMFVCGDATRNLEVMAALHCNNIAIDEQIPLDKIRDLVLPANKSFGGNLKLTTVLLMGDEEDAKLNAIECIDSAGDQSFVLAPGCDLPYDVKPENLSAVATMVHDEYQRDVARNTINSKQSDSFDDIVLPDYQNEDAVIIDVVTLDSEGCAPCQYMFKAALDARTRLGDKVKIVLNEHKITTREGVGMMVKLQVPNLPSICIDGQCKFASITPDTALIVEEIVNAARKKQEVES